MPPPKPYRQWNDLAAYQFDSAVLYLGLVIENAIQEREEYSPTNARQSRAKYTLSQLLDADFRLPAANSQQPAATQGGHKAMAAANPGMVGRWKQAPPKGM